MYHCETLLCWISSLTIWLSSSLMFKNKLWLSTSSFFNSILFLFLCIITTLFLQSCINKLKIWSSIGQFLYQTLQPNTHFVLHWHYVIKLQTFSVFNPLNTFLCEKHPVYPNSHDQAQKTFTLKYCVTAGCKEMFLLLVLGKGKAIPVKGRGGA
jgi:hypothetical protein